jgi:hypothetical protein
MSYRDIRTLANRHKGATIYVVATGTSLRGFPWAALNGQVVIAVNDAVLFFRIPPTVHLFNDPALIRRYGDTTDWRSRKAWKGRVVGRPEGWRYASGQIVVTQQQGIKRFRHDTSGSRVDLYRYNRNTHFERERKTPYLYMLRTVAVPAMHLAWYMGAAHIGLLGFDAYVRGSAWYHWEDFDDDTPMERIENADGHIEDMSNFRTWLDRQEPRTTVTHYSPESPCEVWEKRDWREAFSIEEATMLVKVAPQLYLRPELIRDACIQPNTAWRGPRYRLWFSDIKGQSFSYVMKGVTTIEEAEEHLAAVVKRLNAAEKDQE